MTTPAKFGATIATVMLAISGVATAQEVQRPMLTVTVNCMKAKVADYANLETEMWLPMHQSLVDRGKLNSWSLYWVLYGDRSKCDYYTIMTYRGDKQRGAQPATEETFAAVHKGDDFAAAMRKTWASREHVASELWMLVDSTGLRRHKFAIVNLMHAQDPDAYVRMESEVFKPGHQALIDGGHRVGWALNELLAPTGTSIPYNFSTVDFTDQLGPVPMAEAMMSANPERDLEAMQDLLKLRDPVRSETWLLVAATEPPQGE